MTTHKRICETAWKMDFTKTMDFDFWGSPECGKYESEVNMGHLEWRYFKGESMQIHKKYSQAVLTTALSAMFCHLSPSIKFSFRQSSFWPVNDREKNHLNRLHG